MQNFNNYNYAYQQNTYAFVDGIEGARAFQCRPNSMMLLMDSMLPMCYKKQTDMYGKTIALEVYDLVPHKDEASKEIVYVTKAEFNDAIEQLTKKLDDNRKMRGDKHESI